MQAPGTLWEPLSFGRSQCPARAWSHPCGYWGMTLGFDGWAVLPGCVLGFLENSRLHC